MATPETSYPSLVSFAGATPVLRVQNLAASIDHYVRVLGFKLVFQAPYFASVLRGKCGLFLCEGDQGHPGGWVWIGVEDTDALLEEYRRSGARIRHSPTNYYWAYEMQVEDIDGNVLRLGSEPKRDEPTGEWLDMRGLRWKRLADGDWRRID